MLPAGKEHQPSDEEDGGEHDEHRVTRLPPAAAVVEHLGRLQPQPPQPWESPPEQSLYHNHNRENHHQNSHYTIHRIGETYDVLYVGSLCAYDYEWEITKGKN